MGHITGMAKQRTKKQVRVSELKRLMEIHPSHEEIAAYFGISVKTWKKLLERDEIIATAYETGIGLGKISLRRKQHALAGYNASMAIHLGKQHLGQEDKSQVEVSGPGGGPIRSETTYDFSKLTDAERATLRSTLEKATGRS